MYLGRSINKFHLDLILGVTFNIFLNFPKPEWFLFISLIVLGHTKLNTNTTITTINLIESSLQQTPKTPKNKNASKKIRKKERKYPNQTKPNQIRTIPSQQHRQDHK